MLAVAVAVETEEVLETVLQALVVAVLVLFQQPQQVGLQILEAVAEAVDIVALLGKMEVLVVLG
jgi:hypothetical protein